MLQKGLYNCWYHVSAIRIHNRRSQLNSSAPWVSIMERKCLFFKYVLYASLSLCLFPCYSVSFLNCCIKPVTKLYACCKKLTFKDCIWCDVPTSTYTVKRLNFKHTGKTYSLTVILRGYVSRLTDLRV